MLVLKIPKTELFNEKTQTFSYIEGRTLHMEHSLLSISKWESKWHILFIGNESITELQMRDYFKCMIINPKEGDEDAIDVLTPDKVQEIENYIADPMTAAHLKKLPESHTNGDPPWSDMIYYYMFSYRISKECEKWHINRLITLITIFALDAQPQKKKTTAEILAHHRAVNAERRAQHRH